MVRLVKAMVFPVVMYGCESWTIKKAENQRIDAFELWCWRRCLRVSWNARRSNQSILMEISPEYSLEGLMLKLKLQYFGHLIRRTDSFERTLMLGKIEGRRRRGWQRMVGWHHWLNGHEFKQAPGAGDGQGSLVCSPGGSQRVRHEWVTELTVRKREDSRSPLNFQSDYEWIIMEPFTQTGKKIVSEVFSLYILNLRFHGGGHVNPLQYSCLENPMDRGVWWATSPWGCKESDMTEQLNTHTSLRLLKTPK